MRKKINFILIIILFGVINSCTVSPRPINYHVDECAFCKMKISDPKFGAELVSTTGKVFTYDSAECLFRTIASESTDKFALTLVTAYTDPNVLKDASSCVFLVSENRPSPMGGNLSAYDDPEVAKKSLQELGGQLYSFYEVLSDYQKKTQ